MDLNKVAIGKRIRAARQSRKYTQSQVAGLVGYGGKQAISAIERGQFEPNSRMLEQFASLFGITVDFLVSGENVNDSAAIQNVRSLMAKLSPDQQRLAESLVRTLYYSTVKNSSSPT